MLKYLIIQLDDTSVSFCHYSNNRKIYRLIPLEKLEAAVLWAMKENLTIQVVYPEYEIPEEYHDVLSRMDHADIVPYTCKDNTLLESADVVVFGSWQSLAGYELKRDKAYVVRTAMVDLIANESVLYKALVACDRLNVVITDVQNFKDENITDYQVFLTRIAGKVKEEYAAGHAVQLNLLTDRMLLDGMNNCNAGVESVTLAPDGCFYICPAFYSEPDEAYGSVGTVEAGLDIKNPQLYRIDHAPICRRCDAWHCRRCVWLNRKATLEVNTPGHEQCVMAHVERNASRDLLAQIRAIGPFMPEKDIPEIMYLDPFDVIEK